MPAAIEGVAGVTAIDFKAGEVTVNAPVPLTLPRLAVSVAEPAATPFAKPVCNPTVATGLLEEIHDTVVVMFCVEPSL